MQSDADAVPALRVALDALLPLADLSRQAAVLRQALKILVADSDRAPSFHFGPRGPRVARAMMACGPKCGRGSFVET